MESRLRREAWVKITPELDVKLLIVAVDTPERVVMSERAVAAVIGVPDATKSNDPYYVPYPVVVELLGYNQYKLWGEI